MASRTSSAVQGVHVDRPAAVTTAVVISVVTALSTYPLFFLPGAEEIPTAAIVISIIGSLVMLVGAWGLWHLRRWGAILTFVLMLLNVVASAPAFIEAPSGWMVAVAAIGIPISIAALVLITLPGARRVYR